MKDVFCNDKFLITLAVLILGLGAYIWGAITGISAENIITAIVSGLFGMGTGMTLASRRKSDDIENKPNAMVK
jgi:hypothetical protein